MIRRAAGTLAVAILKGIARLPLPLAHACGVCLLPLYLLLRPAHRMRVRTLARLTTPSPQKNLARLSRAFRSSSMRLRLALLSLRHLQGRPDGCLHVVENTELYHAALRSGKPVALLGWHQGPVELLHRIPHADPAAAGRVKVLMTAGAFAPALTAFMRAGRDIDGKVIARPGDRGALRRWVRDSGILAVMVDQVPGSPDAWTALENGVRIPWPRRLMTWIESQGPVCLAVSVRWEKGNRIVFRYDDLAPRTSSPSAFSSPSSTSSGTANDAGMLQTRMAAIMSAGIRRAPEQYNWSYPKIRHAAATE